MSLHKKIRARQLGLGSVDSNTIRNLTIKAEDIAPNSLRGEMFVDGGIPSSKLEPVVTLKGNAFNGPNQLLCLNGDGKIPSSLIGSSIYENIATTNLLDVDGNVNNPGGLVKLDTQGNINISGKVYATDVITTYSLVTKVFRMICETEINYVILNVAPTSIERVLVYINGVLQYPNKVYNIDENVVEFTEPLIIGDELQIIYN